MICKSSFLSFTRVVTVAMHEQEYEKGAKCVIEVFSFSLRQQHEARRHTVGWCVCISQRSWRMMNKGNISILLFHPCGI